jgi:hypothetical protein
VELGRFRIYWIAGAGLVGDTARGCTENFRALLAAGSADDLQEAGAA